MSIETTSAVRLHSVGVTCALNWRPNVSVTQSPIRRGDAGVCQCQLDRRGDSYGVRTIHRACLFAHHTATVSASSLRSAEPLMMSASGIPASINAGFSPSSVISVSMITFPSKS